MITLSIQCNDERIPPSSFQNQDPQSKKKAVISKTGEMLFPSYLPIPIITNCLDVNITPEYKNFTESETQFFDQYFPVGLGYKY